MWGQRSVRRVWLLCKVMMKLLSPTDTVVRTNVLHVLSDCTAPNF